MPRSGKDWLSGLFVQRQKNPGFFADGGGLYLRVVDSGAKYWAFRYGLAGKRREMFIGKFPDTSLSEARDQATVCRKQVGQGIDPIEARKTLKATAAAQKAIADARSVTFEWCAEEYMKAHRDAWRNSKHRQQWENTLKQYAYPLIGAVPVADVSLDLVLRILQPIWTPRTETATRLRGRIEVILDWAHARDFRLGENPARWKGKLQTLLADPAKLIRVRHHPALPYSEIPSLLPRLQKQVGMGPLALQFLILTASRTNEVLGARWSEIDLRRKEWAVPGIRMKTGREHRVPLCHFAIDVLQQLNRTKDEEGYVFPSSRTGGPLSNMAMALLLRRMGKSDITVHGFRSTFRDWCAEQTDAPREVAEACLAHTSGDKVEAAYLRTDFLEKRRELLDRWGRYCFGEQKKKK